MPPVESTRRPREASGCRAPFVLVSLSPGGGLGTPTMTEPPGARISMSPPCSVLNWLKDMLMSPE